MNYDTDDDGLIEVSSLVQLNAIRWDPDGDGTATHAGYGQAFPGAASGMGCPSAGCSGYELTADLDFDTNGNGRADAGDAYWNDGKGWLPIHGGPRFEDRFNATFDGGGNTISNLYINRQDTSNSLDREEALYGGLFTYLHEEATVKRLGLVAVNVTMGFPGQLVSSRNVGALAGENKGTINDCYATGSVTNANGHTGGLVGRNLDGSITDSYATVSVTANAVEDIDFYVSYYIGGLVGHNVGSISHSHATGNVTSDVTGTNAIPGVGGLVGGNIDGSIAVSYATGSVSGTATNNERRATVGGLVGTNGGSPITNSYATGSVSSSGFASVGGLTGSSHPVGNSPTDFTDSSISSSYATGRVTSSSSDNVGGLVGSDNRSSIADSYWDTQASGQSSSDGGIGKTTRELQSPTSNTGIYANWDPSVWDFGTSSQYPTLKSGGSATPTPPGSSTTDREALVALYNATDGDNWANNDNWLTDTPLGDWYGVSTDGNGRVNWLVLRDNQLSGWIPPELGNLTNLVGLTLGLGQLTGEIPAELGNLSNLTHLGLYGNGLAGGIPEELGNLSSLSILLLGGNNLSGEVPAVLGNLSNLTDLGLRANRLSGEIPPALGNLSNLTFLGLANNNLTGDIPGELGRLTNLERLYLGGRNQLTGCVPVTLRDVPENDFDELGLPFCGDTPPSFGDCLEDLGTLSDSFTRTGTWTTDCPSTYKPDAYARFYSFTLDQESTVDIELIPNPPNQGGDTRHLRLLRGVGREGNPVVETDNAGCCPAVTLPLAAGTYTVEAINENVGPNEGFILEVTLLASTGTPIADNCLEDLGTLTAAASRTGEWTSDCAGTKSGNYARFYSFTLDEEREVTIDLTSETDTVLNLLRGKGKDGDVVANNDDAESGNTNSRITRNLAAGIYTIEATTYSAGVTGNFNLSITLSEGTTDPDPTPTDDCSEDLGALTARVDRFGTWTEDCASSNREGRYARFYSFSLSQETEVTIRVSSSFDTFLYLLEGAGTDGTVVDENDDLESGNSNSGLTVTLGAGSYTVEATTFRGGLTGGFDLSIQPAGATPPTPVPGSCIQTLGPLAAAAIRHGSWTGECDSGKRTGSYARYYSFSLDREAEVQIDLASTVDTYLYLLEGVGTDGRALDENDDAESGSTNSRISITLQPGEYTVEATTFGQGATGDFTLEVVPGVFGEPPAQACLQALPGDGSVTGEWTDNCHSETRDGSLARYYTFTLPQESAVTITLSRTSGNADTYLYLREGATRSGAALHENDDHDGITVSQIQETLAAGAYTIEATTFSAGQTGSFTLAISGLGGAPPVTDTCVQPLTADGTVPGKWLEGCQSEVSGRGYARYYTFTLTQSSEVTITLESQDADTYLYLREGEARSGTALHENDDHDGITVSQIRETLAGGAYTIEATTYSENQTGDFTLTISGLADGVEPPPPDACEEPLTSNGTASGEWVAGCESEVPERGYAKYYGFTLSQSSEVTITLESQDADTYLYLREGVARSGTALHYNDDHQGSRSVSQIGADLEVGAYIVEATTYGEGETGSFTLTIEGLPGRAGSLESDRAALVALYDATGGDNWANNDNWLSDEAIRQWHGVSGDSEGRARVVALSSNGLEGTLPADLGNLDRLERLFLTDNQLGGEIPSTLGNLSSLEVLHLNSNQLSGGIPASLGNLTGLTSLRLNTNQLTGEIPSALGNLDNLQVLGLSGNRLTGCVPGGLRDVPDSDVGLLGLSFCDDTSTPPIPTPGDECLEDLGTLGTSGRVSTGRIGEQWAGGCDSETRPGSHARYYTFTLESVGEVTITLESGDADTYLYLREGRTRSGTALHQNDDHQGSRNTSQIQEALLPGEYTIEATTYGPGRTGRFNLTVTEPQPADPCLEALGTLEVPGQVHTGGIWPNPLGPGCDSETREGSHARFFSFTLAQETTVTIDLEVTFGGADSYLYLREGATRSGTALHENDDHEGSRLRSRVQETLAAGSYTIEATTYDPGQTGIFSLTVAAGDGAPSDACVTDMGVLAQTAQPLQPVTLDGSCESESQAGRYARYYTFTLPQETDVIIALEPSDTDTYLYLREEEARSGDALRENDDRVEGDWRSGSEINLGRAVGTYTIEATTFAAGQTGRFDLIITPLPTVPSDCITELNDLRPLPGAHTRGGSWSSVCPSAKYEGGYARYYVFNLYREREETLVSSEDTGVTIYVAPTSEYLRDTHLTLREASIHDGQIRHDGREIKSTDDYRRLAAALENGTYVVEAGMKGDEPRGRDDFALTIGGPGVELVPPELVDERPSDTCTTYLGKIEGPTHRTGRWTPRDHDALLGLLEMYSALVPDTKCVSANRGQRTNLLLNLVNYAKFYVFELEQSTDLTITVDATSGSPVLYLMEGDVRDRSKRIGNAAENPGHSNVTMTWTLDPGTYTLDVTTQSRGMVGGFNLTISGPTPPTPSGVQSRGETNDWEALVQLYGSTAGSYWRNNENWLTAAPLRDWAGVTTNRYGRVIALDLNSNGLEGELPPGLPPGQPDADDGGLSQLVDLRLQHNRLRLPIRPWVAFLPHSGYGSLRVAHLYDNDFSDCVPLTVNGPVEVAYAEYVTAQVNRDLLDEILDTVASIFAFFVGYTEDTPADRLVRHMLLPTFGMGIPPCAPPVESDRIIPSYEQSTATDRAALERLYEVTDGDNWRDNSDWLRTDVPLGRWQGVHTEVINGQDRVTRLDLSSNNNLTGELPGELGNLTHLEFLNLSQNKLTSNIPRELGNLRYLHTLALNDNQLTGEIPPELGNIVGGCDGSLAGLACRALHRPFLDLHLQNNQLSGEIPGALSNIGYLRAMTTQPGNDELTGCVVPNRVLDTLRAGSGALSNWAVSKVKLGDRAADAARPIFKNRLAERLPGEVAEEFGDLLADELGKFIDDVIAGVQEKFNQFVGLGDVENVACKQ